MTSRHNPSQSCKMIIPANIVMTRLQKSVYCFLEPAMFQVKKHHSLHRRQRLAARHLDSFQVLMRERMNERLGWIKFDNFTPA